MDEKTAKIKTVIIDDMHVQTVLQFKIDGLSTEILEFNYILHAVNGDFSSIPVKISLVGDKTRLLGCLRYSLNNFNKKDEYFRINIDSFGGTNCDYMAFEQTDNLDSAGRRLIEFTTIINSNHDTLMIPYEIFPRFLEAFIKIVDEKDIELPKKKEEVSKEPVEELTEEKDEDKKDE